jgi:hypothetical protein
VADEATRWSFTRPFRGRLALLWLVALTVMLPWPAAAVAINWSEVAGGDEAVLFFGGLTAIPLALLALVGLPPSVLVVVPIVLWVAVAAVPGFWVRRREVSRRTLIAILGGQAGFSVLQAVMGQLMIWGRHV